MSPFEGETPERRQQNNAGVESKISASWLSKVNAVEVFVDERACVLVPEREGYIAR